MRGAFILMGKLGERPKIFTLLTVLFAAEQKESIKNRDRPPVFVVVDDGLKRQARRPGPDTDFSVQRFRAHRFYPEQEMPA